MSFSLRCPERQHSSQRVHNKAIILQQSLIEIFLTRGHLIGVEEKIGKFCNFLFMKTVFDQLNERVKNRSILNYFLVFNNSFAFLLRKKVISIQNRANKTLTRNEKDQLI